MLLLQESGFVTCSWDVLWRYGVWDLVDFDLLKMNTIDNQTIQADQVNVYTVYVLRLIESQIKLYSN